MNYKIVPVTSFESDEDLSGVLQRLNIRMAPFEARRVAQLLGRNPSLVELFIFDIEWSEHCSYKSSRAVLKAHLPVEAQNVILGPGEDAGIIKFVSAHGVNYAIVIAHESHNHPSQILPVEGAATGIGGVVRDVNCMGARVCAVANGLRFGSPAGDNKVRACWIARGVMDGIWRYGNALGVPTIAGDLYFDASFNENCLVNVVSIGIVEVDSIIPSRVPPEAAEQDFDLILVGKATDASGFGGVTFASEVLRDEVQESHLGAVQIPDPFLENMLISGKANTDMIHHARRRGVPVGMKDLGGGGLACAASELCAASGFGADIRLDDVHLATPDIPPEVIACSETQERFLVAVPPDFTEEVLKIYNETWDLPGQANGAAARVIGKTRKDGIFVLKYRDITVCEAPVQAITAGIACHPESRPRRNPRHAQDVPDMSIPEALAAMLASENGCSRSLLYRHYDSEVQGATVLRPGEADAGVIAPLLIDGISPACIALSLDGNPFLCDIDPYWGAAAAVAESMRNVIAAGAVPKALTDCLNYGNPNDPEVFHAFEQGVMGLADAARNLWQFGTTGEPVPIVSGNVSFYNESDGGYPIKPSPVVACVGIIDDFHDAVSLSFKDPGNKILLVGKRRDTLAGSFYYRLMNNHLDGGTLTVDWEQERKDMHAVIRILKSHHAVSCHDISEGGLLMAIAEMCLAGEEPKTIGAELWFENVSISLSHLLFSESGGFILEIPPDREKRIMEITGTYGADAQVCGFVTGDAHIRVKCDGAPAVNIPVHSLKEKWEKGLEDVLR